jgi:hypothetical protein
MGHLFDPFSKLYNYFCIILVWDGFVIEKSTPFSFLGSFTHSFRIRSGMIISSNHFHKIKIEKIIFLELDSSCRAQLMELKQIGAWPILFNVMPSSNHSN